MRKKTWYNKKSNLHRLFAVQQVYEQEIQRTMTTKDFQTKRPLAIFLSYFRPHRRLFALDIICAFMISLVDLAFPLISRTAMYQWLPQQQYRTFFIVMGIVVLAFVLRSFLCFVVGYWGHTFGIRVEADIRRDLFRHMQELGFDFYDRNRTGQLMSRLTSDLFEVTELAHHGPEDLFISAVTIVGALIVMFSIQWRLALVVSLIIPIFMVVVMYRRRQMSAASRAAKQKTGVINAEIESGLSDLTAPTRYSRPPSVAFIKRWAFSTPAWSSSSASCPWRSSPWAAGSS